MKPIKYVFVLLFASALFLPVFAQNETVPRPPKPPDEPDVSSYWKLTEQEEQSYLEDLDAEIKLKLKDIKAHDANKYAEYLRELHWRRMENHFMVKGRDRERLELERKITESEIRTEALAIKYESAPSEEIKKELTKSVRDLFDQKEQQRKWEIEMLENEIKELKKKITSRQQNKETIIRRRVEELLGVEDDLEWD
jgi:hypothetical protein